MEKAAGQPPGEICDRCLQPIAPSARRCPNCGERRFPTNRLPVFMGILGLLALVLAAIAAFTLMRNSGTDSAPTDQTEQSAPQKPEKPPPFNP
jgi:hypothetical protein